MKIKPRLERIAVLQSLFVFENVILLKNKLSRTQVTACVQFHVILKMYSITEFLFNVVVGSFYASDRTTSTYDNMQELNYRNFGL